MFFEFMEFEEAEALLVLGDGLESVRVWFTGWVVVCLFLVDSCWVTGSWCVVSFHTPLGNNEKQTHFMLSCTTA